MFNLGACPEFSNFLYKTSYVHNMSVSLLVLIGPAAIVFVSYAYSINMYCIHLLLLTGKHPFKYLYTLPVSGFDIPIAANT